MTVQQEQPTAVLAPVSVPVPRRAAHDALAPPVVRRTGAWVTREEQLLCRWMSVAMLALGLFAALMVWLSARVW